ncbi:hypothetical protein [Streptococcus sp. TATVAM-FAB21]
MIALAVLIVGIMFCLEILSKNGRNFKNAQKAAPKTEQLHKDDFFSKM